MKVSKQLRGRLTRQKAPIGLTATGSSGPWQVDIDETTSGRTRWFFRLDGPSIYLSFEIRGLAVIADALRLLSAAKCSLPIGESSNERDSSVALGRGKTAPVSLVRDNEFWDRVFLKIESKDGIVAQLTIAGEDLANFCEALRQVIDDIGAE